MGKQYDDEGYEIKPKIKIKPVVKKQAAAPYVVVDNTNVIRAVEAQSTMVRQVLEQISKEPMKPKSFTLDIKRNAKGFMTQVKVTLDH